MFQDGQTQMVTLQAANEQSLAKTKSNTHTPHTNQTNQSRKPKNQTGAVGAMGTISGNGQLANMIIDPMSNS